MTEDSMYADLHRLRTSTLLWITAVLFHRPESAQTNAIAQPDPVVTADVGGNVTLHCSADSAESFIWYKQQLGREPRVMVTVLNTIVFEEEFGSPRFSIEKEGRFCHLKIAAVERSDEALYYCGVVKIFKVFGNGTYLSVNDKADFSVSVVQSGESDPVPAGGSVTLQCSVLSESRSEDLRVLWFRAASPPSRPQILYAQRHGSQRCESGSSTHTCLYNFSQNVVGLEDSGVYYCAVTLCRSIVFGSGTRLQLASERPADPLVICLTVALVVCTVVIFALVFVIIHGRRNPKLRVRLKQDSPTDRTFHQGRDNEELSYAALRFDERKRERVRKEQPKEIIYSDVQGLWTN